MTYFRIVSLALAVAAPLWAETPQKIDVSGLPAQAKVIDNVLVPVPSEVFNVLDKLGSRPNWADVLRPTKETVKVPSEQAQIALQMGVVIAEGFIAVEAENPDEVKKIGGSVRKLAKALGVEKKVDERARAIIDGAEKKDWQEVRRELDKAQSDVKSAMVELNSEPLSQLISIGGWLRGTEALTEVVGRAFSRDGAELLHQPALLDFFDRKLGGMPAKLKRHPLLAEVQKGVLEIRPLVGAEDGTQISEKSVKAVGEVTSRLVKKIGEKH
ncbi:MAG: hypothetical protein ABMA13_13435 [Chthoniobacteraceae bacterium]